MQSPRHVRQLAAVVESFPDALFVLVDDRIAYANAAAEATFAAGDHPALTGRSFFDLLDAATFAARMRLVVPSEPFDAPHEYLLRTLDGEAVHAEVTKSLCEWDGAPAVMLIVRDVGQGRPAESLLESKERFRSLVEEAVVGIYRIEGLRLTYVNPALCRMFATTAEDLIALPSVLDLVIPEERPLFEAHLRRCYSGVLDGARQRLRCVRSDGRPITIEVSGTAIVGDSGLAVIGTVLDLADRLELQERLDRSERLTALGQAAATIAHEMRNVLMAISPYSEIIARRSREPQIVDAARRIQDVVKRGKKVTEEILEYTRRADPVFVVVNVADWIASLRAEILNTVGPSIETEFDLRDSDLWIRADVSQLNTALMNLVINARDAMGGTGTLRLAAGRAANGRIAIVIHDSGPGVSSDIRERIFAPFFTTKHRGTGLGLAVVERVVALHGGEIAIFNDRGAKFVVTFPEADGANGHASGTVLVSS